ncbi:MAG: hypothetical protein QOK49_4456, partial [Baekduia sp.]|nr:hypothetical protein [Baekduia sp.]
MSAVAAAESPRVLFARQAIVDRR